MWYRNRPVGGLGWFPYHSFFCGFDYLWICLFVDWVLGLVLKNGLKLRHLAHLAK